MNGPTRFLWRRTTLWLPLLLLLAPPVVPAQPAADDAFEQNRPLFLGEFGAYDKAPMESRGRYTASVARAAEKRGWSWAYWQFDSDFILYDIGRDVWVEPILRALIPAAGSTSSRPPFSTTTINR